jgi:hypothetical protein
VGGFLLLGLVGLMSQKALLQPAPTAQVAMEKPAVVKHHQQKAVERSKKD